jgi:NAD(P)H-dependent FMN reductase
MSNQPTGGAIRSLVFSGSLREESLNTRLAGLVARTIARTIARHGGEVELASMASIPGLVKNAVDWCRAAGRSRSTGCTAC